MEHKHQTSLRPPDGTSDAASAELGVGGAAADDAPSSSLKLMPFRIQVSLKEGAAR